MNRKPNVLIVDDEEIVRRSYRRLLSGADCNADTAADGADAMHAMAREAFDVVLLDLRMPGADGMSVLRAMRASWPESEVVVITGHPTLETAKEALRLGAYEYLAKPVEPEKVIKVARTAALHKRWALRAVTQVHEQRSMQ